MKIIKKVLSIFTILYSVVTTAQMGSPELYVNVFANNGNHYGNDNPNGNGNNGNPDGNNGGTNNGNGGTNNGNGGTSTNNGGTNNGNGQNDLAGSGGAGTGGGSGSGIGGDVGAVPLDDHLPVLIILALGIISIRGKAYRQKLVA